MKKSKLLMALLLTTGLWFTGCSNGDQQQQIDQLTHQLDSMKQENDKKDGDINLDTFQILLSNQKQQIAQLSATLRTRGDSISKLYTLVSYLNAQLEEKDEQIQALRAELDSKDIDIDHLRQRVSMLTDANSRLHMTVERQADVVSKQDKLLNEAYVKIGTKKELSELGLTTGGFLKKTKLNPEAIQQNQFVKVDIRKYTEININSSNPKILTQMPASSYRIEKGKKSSVLYILDPAAFWSVSNYLVIQTK